MLKNLLPGVDILVTILTSFSLHAQNIVEKMDSAFTDQFKRGQLMGNILVSRGRETVYQHSFGYQDIAHKRPNVDSSAFALASASKSFTATAILQLKEKGKLRLDDAFIKYFPEFPFPNINIRHLLTHTSGLPEYELFDSLIEKYPQRIYTNNDIIPALRVWSKGLYFAPGESWRYSSMNYCLLALLIEKLSRQSLSAYLQHYIFKPCAMKHTYVENFLLNINNPNRTINYEYPFNYSDALVSVDSIAAQHKMVFNLGGFTGQGGITSTCQDLLLFDRAFVEGKLVTKEDAQEAFRPVKLNNGKEADFVYDFADLGSSGYGLGWIILRDSSRGRIVWHDGSRPGVSSTNLLNLTTGETIIVLQNSPGDGNGTAVSALNILHNRKPIVHKISLIRLFGSTLIRSGVDDALSTMNNLRDDSLYTMPAMMDWAYLCYQLRDNDRYLSKAADAFRIASVLFPEVWFINKGYGDVMIKQGKKQAAILLYRKATRQSPSEEMQALLNKTEQQE